MICRWANNNLSMNKKYHRTWWIPALSVFDEIAHTSNLSGFKTLTFTNKRYTLKPLFSPCLQNTCDGIEKKEFLMKRCCSWIIYDIILYVLYWNNINDHIIIWLWGTILMYLNVKKMEVTIILFSYRDVFNVWCFHTTDQSIVPYSLKMIFMNRL